MQKSAPTQQNPIIHFYPITDGKFNNKMLFNSSPSIGGCNVIPWCYNAWLRIIIIIQPALNEDGARLGRAEDQEV